MLFLVLDLWWSK